jgi:hypothetical protein
MVTILVITLNLPCTGPNIPSTYSKNLDEYAANRALVFEGIEFLGVWIYLMRKKYEKLASHVVNINGMFASEDEVVSLLKNRTAKIV